MPTTVLKTVSSTLLRIPRSRVDDSALETAVADGLLTPTSVFLSPDSSSETGVSVLGALIDIQGLFSSSDPPSPTIVSVRAMAMRMSDFHLRPATTASNGIRVTTEPGTTYRFGTIRDIVPGPDNLIAIWVTYFNSQGVVETKVAQFLLNALIKQPITGTLAPLVRATFRAHGTELPPGTMIMGRFAVALVNGQPRITQPDASAVTPPNVNVGPIPQTPFYMIPSVAGEVQGANIVAVWGCVLRANAIIPDNPMGTPNPVAGRAGQGPGTFVIDNVPGAVLGLDNKLVTWITVANLFGPPLRALCLFNGV